MGEDGGVVGVVGGGDGGVVDGGDGGLGGAEGGDGVLAVRVGVLAVRVGVLTGVPAVRVGVLMGVLVRLLLGITKNSWPSCTVVGTAFEMIWTILKTFSFSLKMHGRESHPLQHHHPLQLFTTLPLSTITHPLLLPNLLLPPFLFFVKFFQERDP